jgi:hypothetical protein
MRFPRDVNRSIFDRAIDQLRDGRPGESGYGRRLALVLTIPTFDDPVARDVRQTASGELYVVRTIWRRGFDTPPRRPTSHVLRPPEPFLPLDLDTLGGRAPSLISTRLPVDASALSSLLSTIGCASIACHPQRADATVESMVYEVTFGSGLTETRYRWAAEPPPGWEPLGRFAVGVIRLVDQPAEALHR